jgi:hypothetical protein
MEILAVARDSATVADVDIARRPAQLRGARMQTRNESHIIRAARSLTAEFV